MKTNEQNFRIEEMEERAVDKSNVAKTAAVAGVMGVAGAGLAVAASQVILDNGEEADPNSITMGDLTEGATEGAEETNIIVETPKSEDPIQEKPAPPQVPEPKAPSMTVEEQVNLYDSEDNLIYSETSGHYEGKQYVFIDSDGDRIIDRMGYDENGNQIIEEHEMRDLAPSEQFMTKDLGQADYVTDLKKYDLPPYDNNDEPKDPADIASPGEEPLPNPEEKESEPEPNPNPNPEPEPEPDPYDFVDDNPDFRNDEDVSDFI